MRRFASLVAILTSCFAGAAAFAEPYRLLTGVDAMHYPGTARAVAPIPGPGFPGTFNDGDRLAGTSDTGAEIDYVGLGEPLFPPNHVGALSFLFRRGSVPVPPNFRVPLMGIEFLGGSLLDLDGDLDDGVRHLTPVPGQTPVEIPDTFSHLDLSFDLDAGTVTINNFDATGTNEGAPNLQSEIATTVTTIAGTTPIGELEDGPNPDFDTRTGSVTPHDGPNDDLIGVYRIEGLQVELWHDSIDPNSGTADVLGTFQHFAVLNGWLVFRDCATGGFPSLAGQGLGSTAWPAIDTEHVSEVFNTAHGLAGGTAEIDDGVPADQYSNNPNGVALADNDGDLGAYLDTVVVPLVDPQATAFVYLESVAFGINNSGDPVFTDTNGYDVVIVAERFGGLTGDIDGDGDVDEADRLLFISALLNPGDQSADTLQRADLNFDCAVDGDDIALFLEAVN